MGFELEDGRMLGSSLDMDDYEVDEDAFGSGSSASVYLARRRTYNERQDVWTTCSDPTVVIKVVNDEEKNYLLMREISMLHDLQGHPNIVGFFGVCHVNEEGEKDGGLSHRLAIQMEFCGGGDLYDAVNKCKFSEDGAKLVLSDLLGALAHVHEAGIVHRDVKPENVLLTSDGFAKLADFGISARLSDTKAMAVSCGSPGYVAPEVLKREVYGIKADTFSAGSVLFFALSGAHAFTGSNIAQVMLNTIRRPVEFTKNRRLQQLSQGAKGFLHSLLAKDPANRPTASDALDMMHTIWNPPNVEQCSATVADDLKAHLSDLFSCKVSQKLPTNHSEASTECPNSRKGSKNSDQSSDQRSMCESAMQQATDPIDGVVLNDAEVKVSPEQLHTFFLRQLSPREVCQPSEPPPATRPRASQRGRTQQNAARQPFEGPSVTKQHRGNLGSFVKATQQAAPVCISSY